MKARMDQLKPMARWLLAGGLVAASLWMLVDGYTLTDLRAGTHLVAQAPSASLVDLGLVGVILFLLALLALVLGRERSAKRGEEARSLEARMVQDLFHGFMRMENRVEALEGALLHRAGRIMTGPRSN